MKTLGLGLKKIGDSLRQKVVLSYKSCCKFASRYPVCTVILSLSLILYLYSPWFFFLLVKNSPVLVSTCLLLGTLLSLGKPHIPQVNVLEKEEEEEEEEESVNAQEEKNDADEGTVTTMSKLGFREGIKPHFSSFRFVEQSASVEIVESVKEERKQCGSEDGNNVAEETRDSIISRTIELLFGKEKKEQCFAESSKVKELLEKETSVKRDFQSFKNETNEEERVPLLDKTDSFSAKANKETSLVSCDFQMEERPSFIDEENFVEIFYPSQVPPNENPDRPLIMSKGEREKLSETSASISYASNQKPTTSEGQGYFMSPEVISTEVSKSKMDYLLSGKFTNSSEVTGTESVGEDKLILLEAKDETQLPNEDRKAKVGEANIMEGGTGAVATETRTREDIDKQEPATIVPESERGLVEFKVKSKEEMKSAIEGILQMGLSNEQEVAILSRTDGKLGDIEEKSKDVMESTTEDLQKGLISGQET